MMKIFLLFICIAFICLGANAQCWQSIKANGYHSAGVKADGTLWTWGYNFYGALGDGTTVDKNVPTQVGTQTDWAQVSVGLYFTIAIKTDGTLWGWGRNDYGQLGIGSTQDKNVPTQVGTATDWITVKTGSQFTVAKRADNKLWVWGRNTTGQLGLGNLTNKTIPTVMGTATDWLTFDCGGAHTLALKDDNSLWVWGNGTYGQSGSGSLSSFSTPFHIGTDTWIEIDATDANSLAIKSDGTLWTCGNNTYGELGIGITGYLRDEFTQVGTNSDWVKVVGGGPYGKALKQDGSMWAWGANSYSVFGTNASGTTNVPVLIGSSSDWIDIEGGTINNFNFKADGTIWGCGMNEYGQLGIGTNFNSQLVQLQCPGGLGIETNALGQFEIIPNPSSSIVSIVSNANLLIDRISILDLSGKVLFDSKEAVREINIQHFENGVYIVKLQSGSNTSIKKLLKY